MNEKIWLSSPHMGGKEQHYIQEAFDHNWVAPLGPNVNGFEEDLQQYLHIPAAAALSSGTAALHLALILSGVGYGDEVICQSFTFSASANPIVYCGATPVFVDSEPDTWNMCPNALEDAIKARQALGKKIKAIIPVHLYGMPAKMDAILKIAERYHIPVIEDAAEALGAAINGKKAGTFGAFGVLSFNGNKIITTSGGGALVSDNAALIEKARFLATQARDAAPHYQHSHIGYNYRMSNISAGIGRGQMEVLDERVAQRRKNNQRYRDFFKDKKGISFQNEPDESYFSNYWLTAVTISPEDTGGLTRETIRLELEKQHIESRPLWKPMHLQPIFADAPYYGGTCCEQLFENGLCLPSGSNLNDQDFERIFSTLAAIK